MSYPTGVVAERLKAAVLKGAPRFPTATHGACTLLA
jgi:hypothetical protein